jgi:hypothetical protein
MLLLNFTLQIQTVVLYQVLNYFFFFFHTSLIIFNCVGWISPRLRKWNLITLLLTACSWFVLGIWFGWGYCLCTDWHYTVRAHLGYEDASNSYIHFLILKVTGIDFSEKLVDTVTVIVFFVSLMISLGLNFRDYKIRRKRSTSG